MTSDEWVLAGMFVLAIILVGAGFAVFYPQYPPVDPQPRPRHRALEGRHAPKATFTPPDRLVVHDPERARPLPRPRRPHKRRHGWEQLQEQTRPLVNRDLDPPRDETQPAPPIYPEIQ